MAWYGSNLGGFYSLHLLTWQLGSSLHAIKVFANPRWEDFEYEYVNDNPTGWFGDGWTENEKLDKINVNYLDDDQIDFPQSVQVWKGSEAREGCMVRTNM